jgi:import receptor subunit TOM70
MSAEPVPISPARNAALDTSSLSSQYSSLPLWNRLSSWASENKAVVYTIAGVAVVVSGAGVIYYLSDSRKGARDEGTEEKKRASKKERRKAKKDRERGQPEARETPKQTGKLGSLHIQPRLTMEGRIKR